MSNDNLNIDRINELAKKKKEQGLTEAKLKSNRNYVRNTSKHLEKGLNNKLRVQR